MSKGREKSKGNERGGERIIRKRKTNNENKNNNNNNINGGLVAWDGRNNSIPAITHDTHRDGSKGYPQRKCVGGKIEKKKKRQIDQKLFS